jgi:hypothetical protein
MLDIIRLIVETLTPVIVLVFGIKIDKVIKKHESTLLTNQKILEKRLEIYDKVIFMINDIFCFHCYIGNWKELSPPVIIEHKRKLDKIMHSYAPLFKDKLLKDYNNFMEEYYMTFAGWGEDAKIRSLYIKRKKVYKNWEDTWIDIFDCKDIQTDKDENNSINIKTEKYNMLLESFKENLEIFRAGNYLSGDRPNINFI